MSKGQERRKEAFLLVAFVQLNMNFSEFKSDASENYFVKYFINQSSYISYTVLNVEGNVEFKLDLSLASIDDLLHIFCCEIFYVAVLIFKGKPSKDY